MQNKKTVARKGNGKWILASALVLAMALSTAGYAMQGFRGFMDGPGGGELFKEHVLSRVDYTVQELKPSPEQFAKYSAIRAKMESALDAASKRRDVAREAIRAELAKPSPDVRKLAETVKAKSRAIPDSVAQQVDYLLEVYDMLTPEQQTKLVTMLKERMDHEGPRHGMWQQDQDMPQPDRGMPRPGQDMPRPNNS